MAAPENITLLNLSGDWVLNRNLSEDFDPLLELQGVSWLTRKAISWATITLHITEETHVEDPPSVPSTINIEQTLTGGIPGSTERRTLDWTDRDHEDGIFGKVVGKSAWVALDDGIEDAWLKEGWLPVPDGQKLKVDGKPFVRSYVVSQERGWTADQVWGFAEFEGKRYYTRRVVVVKGEERRVARLVYDLVKTA